MRYDVRYRPKEEIANFVAQRVGGLSSAEDFGQYFAVGLYDNKQIVAGLIFNNYKGYDIDLTVAADRKDWISREFLKFLAKLLFQEIKVPRVSSIVGGRDLKLIKLNKGLGFTLEGISKRAYDGELDAYRFGMLKEDCRWLL